MTNLFYIGLVYPLDDMWQMLWVDGGAGILRLGNTLAAFAALELRLKSGHALLHDLLYLSAYWVVSIVDCLKGKCCSLQLDIAGNPTRFHRRLSFGPHNRK